MIFKPSKMEIDIPEKSKYKSTELHEAARRHDSSHLRKLLEDGADPNERDEDGRIAIHTLLEDEFRGHLNESKMLECLEVLLNYGCGINTRDKNGEYPLTLAVSNNFESAALFLVKNKAELYVRTPKFKGMHSLASRIALKMPDVMMEILDSGVKMEDNIDHGQPIVKLDWRPVLQYTTEMDSEQGKIVKRKMQRETSFLYSLLDVPPNTRFQYLTHPLVSALLHLRIRKTKKNIYWFQLLMTIYPLCYMVFIYFLYFDICKLEKSDDDEDTTLPPCQPDMTTMTSVKKQSQAEGGRNTTQACTMTTGITVTAYLLSIVLAGTAIVEVIMLLRIDFKYLKSWRAWVLRASIITMACTLWPALQINDITYNISWQYPIAALGAFFSWIMFLLQMELIPKVKIYLEMLASIVLSVVKIILLFLPLFIGFYFGFNLMFFDINNIMTFILMSVDVGSNEYEEMINSAKDARWWFTTMSDIFSVVFILIIAIVFMNFLLGASISDIQELKRNARIMTLSHKVQNMFVINLVIPFRYDVVTRDDITKGNWYYTYSPNLERAHKAKLSEKIRTKITSLLKSRSSSAQDNPVEFVNGKCWKCHQLELSDTED